jgi:hypothetical protein
MRGSGGNTLARRIACNLSDLKWHEKGPARDLSGPYCLSCKNAPLHGHDGAKAKPYRQSSKAVPGRSRSDRLTADFSLHRLKCFEKATEEPSRFSYCPDMDSEEIIALFVFGVFASAIIFGVAAFVL